MKPNNISSDVLFSNIGFRQGECLSPFLFFVYLIDLEETFILNGATGIEIEMLKLFLLLYADDIVLFANSAIELQNSIHIL